VIGLLGAVKDEPDDKTIIIFRQINVFGSPPPALNRDDFAGHQWTWELVNNNSIYQLKFKFEKIKPFHAGEISRDKIDGFLSKFISLCIDFQGNKKKLGLLSLDGVWVDGKNNVVLIDYGWKSLITAEVSKVDEAKWIHQGMQDNVASGEPPANYSESKAIARFVSLLLAGGDLNVAQKENAFPSATEKGKTDWKRIWKAQNEEISDLSTLKIDAQSILSIRPKPNSLYKYAILIVFLGVFGLLLFLFKDLFFRYEEVEFDLKEKSIGSLTYDDLVFENCEKIAGEKIGKGKTAQFAKIRVKKLGDPFTVTLKLDFVEPTTTPTTTTTTTTPTTTTPTTPTTTPTTPTTTEALRQLKALRDRYLEIDKNLNAPDLLNRTKSLEALKKALVDNPKAKEAPGGEDFVRWVETRISSLR